MIKCYSPVPESQKPVKPLLTCSAAYTLIFNIPTLYSICKQDPSIFNSQLNEMQHVNNLNVCFALGNKLYIRKLNPLFPMFMNLAFKKCIRQCFLSFL